jgi:hypothetical protein
MPLPDRSKQRLFCWRRSGSSDSRWDVSVSWQKVFHLLADPDQNYDPKPADQNEIMKVIPAIQPIGCIKSFTPLSKGLFPYPNKVNHPSVGNSDKNQNPIIKIYKKILSSIIR